MLVVQLGSDFHARNLKSNTNVVENEILKINPITNMIDSKRSIKSLGFSIQR